MTVAVGTGCPVPLEGSWPMEHHWVRSFRDSVGKINLGAQICLWNPTHFSGTILFDPRTRLRNRCSFRPIQMGKPELTRTRIFLAGAWVLGAESSICSGLAHAHLGNPSLLRCVSALWFSFRFSTSKEQLRNSPCEFVHLRKTFSCKPYIVS